MKYHSLFVIFEKVAKFEIVVCCKLFQIWNSNVIKDTYMGKHLFLSAEDCTRKIESVGLVGRGRDGDKAKAGKLVVEITQSRNMALI